MTLQRSTYIIVLIMLLTTGLLGFQTLFASQSSTLRAEAASSYILASNYYVLPDSVVTIRGFGFGPSEQVRITWDSAQVQTNANSQGEFSIQLTTPFLQPGIYPLEARGLTSGQSSVLNISIAGFYPTINVSNHFLIPENTATVAGRGFAPNEKISIFRDGNLVRELNTDGGGNFTDTTSLKARFSDLGRTIPFTITSEKSRFTSTVNISVGQFYPQIEPSTYYLNKGATFSVSGRNFAPNEDVKLFVAGTEVSQHKADGGGNVNFTGVRAPSSGTNFSVRATGQLSGQSSERVITLAQ